MAIFMNKKIFIPLIAFLGTACGSAPMSFIEGHPFLPIVQGHHYPVRVIAVDHHAEFSMPVQLVPGQHNLLLTAGVGKSAVGSVEKVVPFFVEACTRYVFVAARNSPFDKDWELVVHSKEAVSGCDRMEEGKKWGVVSGTIASN